MIFFYEKSLGMETFWGWLLFLNFVLGLLFDYLANEVVF